jgi:heme/copper-type cytochrome/quinol oxidase subunit 2
LFVGGDRSRGLPLEDLPEEPSHLHLIVVVAVVTMVVAMVIAVVVVVVVVRAMKVAGDPNQRPPGNTSLDPPGPSS